MALLIEIRPTARAKLLKGFERSGKRILRSKGTDTLPLGRKKGENRNGGKSVSGFMIRQ